MGGGTTAEALSERLASGGAAGDQLLVNQRIHSSKQVLRMGDQVEMVSSGYAEEFFESDGEDSDLEDPEFEFEREKLARMYSGRGRKQRVPSRAHGHRISRENAQERKKKKKEMHPQDPD